MAGLFDYEDPQSAGRLAFAAGLLNASGPQRMPVSFGQALAQALTSQQQASTEAAMNRRRNQLTDAQIGKLQEEENYRRFLQNKGIDPDLPKDIISAQLYMKMTPEEKRMALEWKRGDYDVFDLEGIKHRISKSGLGGAPAPLTTPQREAASRSYIEGTVEGAKAGERARFDRPIEGYDPVTGRMTYRSLIDMAPPSRLQPPDRLPNALVSPPQSAPAQVPVQAQPPQAATQPDMEGQRFRRMAELVNRRASLNPVEQAELASLEASFVPPRGRTTPSPMPRAGFEPPKQLEEEKEKEKSAGRIEDSVANIDRVIKQIDGVAKRTDWSTTGPMGSIGRYLPFVPGPQADYQAALSPIINRVALQEIQKMREDSKTGAALGNVSDADMARVEGAIASLNTVQGPQEMRRSLTELRDSMQNLRDKMQTRGEKVGAKLPSGSPNVPDGWNHAWDSEYEAFKKSMQRPR